MKECLKDDFPNESGIIYCIKKADCVKLSSFLEMEGFSATFYNGDVPKDEQKRRLANWMSGQVKVCFYLLLLVSVNSFSISLFKIENDRSKQEYFFLRNMKSFSLDYLCYNSIRNGHQ